VALTTTISLQIFCSDVTHRSILSSSLPQIKAATKRGCVLIFPIVTIRQDYLRKQKSRGLLPGSLL
jgi:hypothetical protein